MEPQLFNIPACNLDILEKKLARLNKKAARAGTGEIKLTRISETVEMHNDGTVDVYYQVAVEGEAPKIAGWAFLARIDHNSDPSGASNLVYVMPGQVCPDDYRNAKADCDHCGYRRQRRDTYVLASETTGELKQVGRTCIQDFIGIDPAKVAAQAERITEIMKDADAAEKSGTLGVPYNRRHIMLELFLAFTAKTVREDGWVGSKQAYGESGIVASKDRALTEMFPYGGYDGEAPEQPSNEDNEKATAAMAYALTLDPAKSDYNHNVFTIAKTGYIDFKAVGLAASIIRIYDLHLGRQAEQKTKIDLSGSEYVGEMKARIRGVVTVIGKKSGMGHYGPWTMFRMVSKNDGNLLVTFATGENFNPEIGDELEIKGTVKKHEVFNGVKQTMLNRVAKAS